MLCFRLITPFPNKCCSNAAALAPLSLKIAFISYGDAVAGWTMTNRLASCYCEWVLWRSLCPFKADRPDVFYYYYFLKEF